ncbi:hypothetical protein PSPO01_08607 [Paraphaeosphaeria sporulosa]
METTGALLALSKLLNGLQTITPWWSDPLEKLEPLSVHTDARRIDYSPAALSCVVNFLPATPRNSATLHWAVPLSERMRAAGGELRAHRPGAGEALALPCLLSGREIVNPPPVSSGTSTDGTGPRPSYTSLCTEYNDLSANPNADVVLPGSCGLLCVGADVISKFNDKSSGRTNIPPRTLRHTKLIISCSEQTGSWLAASPPTESLRVRWFIVADSKLDLSRS